MFGTTGEERTDPRTILGATVPVVLGVGGIQLIGGAAIAALLTAAIVGGIAAAIAALQWSHRWFELGPTEVRLRSGILSRDQRVIPYSRIQQVDHRQKLVHQVLGLAVVHIDTAAESGVTSLEVDALPVAEAERLREELLRRRSGAAAGATAAPAAADGAPLAVAAAPSAAPDPPTEVLRIPDGRLALAGCTGAPILGALVVLLWPLSFVLELGLLPEERVGEVAEEAAATTVSVGLVLGGVAGLLIVLLAGAAVLTIVQWHGYSLAVSDDDVLVRHGLFDVRRLTIPRRRIQQVTIADNPLRRWLGYVTVHLHSAASGAAGGGGGNVLAVPLVRADDADALVARLMGDERWCPQAVAPRPTAARRRGVVRRTAVLALAALPVAIVLAPAGLVVLGVAALGVPWGLAAHRRAGFATNGSTATLAAGVVLHRTEVVALEKLQSTRTTSSPFQRRVDLATLHLDVAGARSSPSLHDLGAEECEGRLRTLDAARA